MTWPDWSRDTAVIVATGPSARDEPLDDLEGRCRIIAIKSSWKLVPFADVLYAMDRDWWIANRGAWDFPGLRVSPSPAACNVYKAQRVTLKTGARILTGETGVIGSGLAKGGGHSGFQALNLAVQFGARRILLVGYDMTLKNGVHWHNETSDAKPDIKRTESWRKEMDDCAHQFDELGVEVINCAMKSALRNYRKQSLWASL